MGDIRPFGRMHSITPQGEAVGRRLERKIHEAITEAENDGLCFGMIVATLAQHQWWMHQRIQEGE